VTSSTVDTVWLRRLYVLFFVSIGTRRIEYAACTSKPDTSWMTQQARNLLMDLDDRGERPRSLIHDRDRRFSRSFDAIFQSEGTEIVRTLIQESNANPYAERWVGSVRRECLDRLLIFGRGRLEQCCAPMSALTTGIDRIGRSRSIPPEQSDGNPAPLRVPPARQLHRRDLLGGLIHESEHAA
jgi:putative transposase